MKFLIIDNYDSFVYNLAQRLGELGVSSDVIRNDKITINEIKNGNYDAIVISPGPGTPEDKRYFGICKNVILELGPETPILGVCLGHQGIIDCFGGKVTNARNIRHGKTSQIKHYGDPITNLGLSEKSHYLAAKSLTALAEKHAQGRIVAFGGGGYNRDNIGRAWTQVVKAFVDHP